MTRLILAFVLSLAGACTDAACRADAGQPRPRLVELYTSEGCSSCPPADDWLRRSDPARIAALEFHVDYWNSLGWRDRFSQARFTARQQAQAAREGSEAVYTPQVVLDGRSWPGWYRGTQPEAIAARLDMNVAVDGADPRHVHVETRVADADAASGFRTYVALTEDGLASEVRAGENRGVRLRHDHVVRAFAGPLPLASAQADLARPDGLDPAHAAVIAFAQRPEDGAVAQVVVCGL